MPGIDDIIVALLERVGELERRVSNSIRHGPVTDVDAKKQLCRLRLNPETEQEAFKSGWVPYGQMAGAFKFHNPPTVGQNMTLLSPGGDASQSIAVPFTWSDKNPSPGDKEEEHVVTFGDLKISYKKDKLTLSVGSASITIEKDKNILMEASEKIRAKVSDKIMAVTQQHVVTVKRTDVGADSETEILPLKVKLIDDSPAKYIYSKKEG